MSRISSLALALACVASLPGCPSDGGSVSLDDVDDQLAHATCDYAARCPDTALARVFQGDCYAMYQPFVDELVIAQIRAGVAAGTIAYHGERVRACLDQFTALSCSSPSLSGPNACNDVFEGLVPDGQACNIENECGPTSTCDTAAASSCPRGTCRHIAQLGEACTSEAGMGCDANLRCASGVCASFAAIGETCTATGAECATGLSCSATSGSGTCMTTPLAQDSEPCGSVGCAAGLVCVSTGTSLQCKTPRTDGTCRFSVSGPGDCAGTQVCSASFGGEGTCGPAPGEGQPCTSTCGDGLRCVSSSSGGTCVRLHRVGETCAGDSSCFSNYCNGGTCAAALLCHT